MKFLVIGHVAVDLLHRSDAPPAESYGGIVHAVRALAAVSGGSATILPVCGVHRSDIAALQDHLAGIPGVDTSLLYGHDGPTHRVHLYERGDGCAPACTPETAPPIPFDRIKKGLDAHGILVNMTSGWDITLETLDEIRMAVRSKGIPIHLDIHNLVRGRNERYERFLRPVPEWRRWAFMVDTIQGNEEEIGALDAGELPEESIAGHLLTLCVRAVVVTRGAHGATVYTSDHKRLVRRDVRGRHANGRIAPPGCGDVFGGAFLHAIAAGRGPLDAAEQANDVAASFAEGALRPPAVPLQPAGG